MNELELLERKDLRMDFIERLEVLDKVKSIIFFMETQICTTEQVAEYFEVSKGTLDSLVKDNKLELVENGMVSLTGVDLKSFKGDLGNPSSLKFASNLNIFNKRAILNVGLLLRDSIIAKKIRSILLDLSETKESKEFMQKEIDEEKVLMLDVLMAKDEESHLFALKSWKDYKDSKLKKIELEKRVAVEKVEHLTKSDATFGLREACTNIGVKEKVFKEYLISNGYMYRQMKKNDTKGNPTGRLKSIAKYNSHPCKYFTDIVVLDKFENSHSQTVFTIDGIEFFRKEMNK